MTDTRVERRLEWVTKDQQQFPGQKPADWLAAVKQGICPFCGTGPFVVVATHVNRVHGYDRREFRDMLGIYYSDSICDPDFAAARSARSKELFKEGKFGIGPSQPGVKKNLSMAAKRRNREQAARITDEQRAENGRRAAVTRMSASAPIYTWVLGLLQTGATFDQIGSFVGVHPRTVRIIAQRNGFDDDGRARYSARRRGRDDASLQAGRAVMIANREVERERRIAFIRDGGTAEELAAQLGMGARQVRYWLRQHGVDVPDARTTKQTPMVTFNCPQCGVEKTITASTYRSNRKAGWGGPYCSLKCGARARVERQARDRVTDHPQAGVT